MSLSTTVVDRLFSRLTLTYGRAFMAQWDGLPASDVKTIWADELSVYAGRLEAIAWALENLPERCPNVIAFRNLCRQAPAAVAPALPEPKADPARVRAELAKLAPLRASTAASPSAAGHGKEWARRLVKRHEQGERLNPYAWDSAQRALRVGPYTVQASA